jgi:hypothetical protein
MVIYAIKNSTAIPTISGHSIVHQKLDARQRAALVAKVMHGEARIELTARQLAKVFNVSEPYVQVALKLTEAKRDAIAKGEDETSFKALQNQYLALIESVKLSVG